MGSVVTKVIRRRPPATSVNIKRPPAPPSSEGPGKEVLHQPNKELLGRLKDVYVSEGERTDKVEKEENTYARERKPLPQETHALYEDPLDDPDAAPPGFLTTKDLVRILQHQQPGGMKMDRNDQWSAERIMQVYGISQEDAENLLRYFTGFSIVGTIKKPIPNMKFHDLTE